MRRKIGNCADLRRTCVSFRLALCGVLLLAAAASAQPALTFSSSQIPSDTGIGWVQTADFNSDGNPDVVFLSDSRLTVVLGNGDGTFQAPIHGAAMPAYYIPLAMVVGDFNNDGKADVVVVVEPIGLPFVGAPPIQTYLGQGDGTFAAPVGSPSSAYVGRPAAVGDVNKDGNLDLIGTGGVALGAGNGTFGPAISVACVSGANNIDIAVADFRNNGNLDIAYVYTTLNGGAVADVEYATVGVCFGNGDGTFSPGPVFGPTEVGVVASQTTPIRFLVLTGDFNGDGNADILTFSQTYPSSAQPVTFSYGTLLGSGSGTFQAAAASASFSSIAPPPPGLPQPVVADMNGDGKSDLVQIGTPSGLSVFLSNGDGSFTDAADLTPAQYPVAIAVADFNNDGLPDIVSAGASVTTVLIDTTVRINSIVNAASLAADQPVAPGSLVAILGMGLAHSVPSSSVGESVTFNGIPAPLVYISPQQINAQVPWEVSGDVEVVVTNGSSLLSTPSFKISTASIAPGVYATNGQAFAFNSDGAIAGPAGSILGIPSHPAAAGDTLTVLANGLGPTTPSVPDGGTSADAVVGSTPVFIGGVECGVPFAGLSPAQYGVNQLSVVVPAGVHGIVPLQINAGGIITTPKVTIAVQ